METNTTTLNVLASLNASLDTNLTATDRIQLKAGTICEAMLEFCEHVLNCLCEQGLPANALHVVADMQKQLGAQNANR